LTWRRTLPIAAIVALCALVVPAACAAKPDLCAHGRRQSPIDIVAPTRVALPALAFDYRSASLRIVNDGHTVRVRFANGSRLSIGRQAATLQQFHFHLPGGDRIRGEEFPMGMHFLHKSTAGQLMAVVVLFRRGAENPALAALLPHMPLAGTAERSVPDGAANALGLIPPEHGYYAYDGSETAPPCTEGVRWLVMKQPLEMSTAQVDALRRLFPSNARAVQPINGRVVQESLP
jgi:carbonic anhydrase